MLLEKNQKLKHISVSAGCLKWRLVFSFLSCIGMAIIYGLKVNLSITIVAMVNQVPT